MAKIMTDDKNYTAIADAINKKKGITEQYLPSEMAPAIESIPTETQTGGNAKPEQVLKGATFTNDNGEQVGTIETYVNDHAIIPSMEGELIPTRGKYVETDILVNGDDHFIPENIKEGVSIFGIDGTAPTPKGNAQPENVMEGVNFSNDSGLQQGTMPIYYGEVHVKPSATAQRLETGLHYMVEDVDVEGDANLSAENIKQGVSIFGVPGTFAGGGLDIKTLEITEYNKTYTFDKPVWIVNICPVMDADVSGTARVILDRIVATDTTGAQVNIWGVESAGLTKGYAKSPISNYQPIYYNGATVVCNHRIYVNADTGALTINSWAYPKTNPFNKIALGTRSAELPAAVKIIVQYIEA